MSTCEALLGELFRASCHWAPGRPLRGNKIIPASAADALIADAQAVRESMCCG
jgi:putative N-acetylmannosamine-6-phosphate epimerase